MGALQRGHQDYLPLNYNQTSQILDIAHSTRYRPFKTGDNRLVCGCGSTNGQERGELCINIIVGKGRLLACKATVSSNYKINITLTVLVTAYLHHIHTQVVAQHYASLSSYYCSLHNSWCRLKSLVFAACPARKIVSAISLPILVIFLHVLYEICSPNIYLGSYRANSPDSPCIKI